MVKGTIGDKIKEARIRKEMSAYRLAQITGFSKSTIMRYENNTIKRISFDNLKRICEALDISIEELI